MAAHDTKGSAAMADDDDTTTGGSDDPAKGSDDTKNTDTGADALKSALDKERLARRHAEKAARDTAAELAGLKAQADSSKSDTQKLEDRLQRLEAEATAANARALRAEVAAEKQLPPKLATRLQGNTREELEADADELLEFATPADTTPRPGSYGGGQRSAGDDSPEDMNALMRGSRRTRQ